MKKIICGLLSTALCFLCFPFCVVNALQNYFSIPNNTCFSLIKRNNDYYVNVSTTNSSARSVIIKDSTNTYYIVITNLVSNNGFSAYGNVANNYACSGYGNNGSSVYVNNVGYRYFYTGLDTNNFDNFNNIPVVNIDTDISPSLAVYYTFGEGSEIEPTPTPVMYSALADVGYNTKIAGSGDAAINNLDTITWNPEQDASGNDISDMSVTIRAVPGKYSAQTSQSILEQLYSNFVLDTLHISELDTVNASDGSFSVTWNDVVHEFDLLGIPGFWFATKDTVKDPEGGYIKRGWIYQVRLEGENYTGDWQTVYTSTSSGVQNDLTIVNSSTINQTLINSITEVNNLNNTENNWYINNTTINMGEYSDPGSSGKPWWAYLLEAIVSLLNGVIDAIANLVGSIIDGLLGLFSFDSFSIPDFSTNKQTIKQNSGIFGESIDILQTMDQTLSNADSTAEPIFYYPGIQLEGVQFIPEMTINLNDYVEDLGLTQWHNLAYTCTDVLIWTSLIYTVYRKLIGVFKR